MKHRQPPRNHTGMNVITSCISTTLVLVLLGTIVFFVSLAPNISNAMRENFTVSLFLNDDIPGKDAMRLQEYLRTLPCARSVTYISKEKAQREQAKAMGSDPAEFLGYSPIPASFEIQLKGDYANSDSLAAILPALKSEKNILEIAYPQELMNAINENIRKVSIVLLVLALLLAFVSFELINNTIQLSIYSRRFLIHTMKLVGAKWSFIRKPFLTSAFWIGVVSAVLAAGLLTAGIAVLLDFEPQMANVVTWQIYAITMGSVVCCGILLTLICAWLSVNKYLRRKANRLYTM